MAISDTPPASPTTGQLWFESDTGLTYIYYDSSWVEIGAGSSYDTVINTIQAKGDRLAGTASQTLVRLTVGTNNQRLIANSSTTTGLSWANDTTNTVIDTKGDLLVGATADVVAKLPVGTDNQVLVANSSATNGLAWVDQPTGFRNKIINGGFDVWQRGTSFTWSSGQPYTADRWCITPGGTAAFSASRQTASLDGFQYCFRLQRTAANTNTSALYVSQPIETITSIPLANKQITFSFNARAGANFSAASSILNVRIITGTGTDGNFLAATLTGQATLLDTTATLTTSWQKFTYSVLVPSGVNQIQPVLLYTPTGTAGAADYFEITGVQFEANTQATPFEQRPIGVELQLCQRYYYRTDTGGNNAAYRTLCTSFANTTTAWQGVVRFPVRMRVAPSAIERYGNQRLCDYQNGFTFASITIDTARSSTEHGAVSVTGASGLTAFRPYDLEANNSTTAALAWSAEL